MVERQPPILDGRRNHLGRLWRGSRLIALIACVLGLPSWGSLTLTWYFTRCAIKGRQAWKTYFSTLKRSVNLTTGHPLFSAQTGPAPAFPCYSSFRIRVLPPRSQQPFRGGVRGLAVGRRVMGQDGRTAMASWWNERRRWPKEVVQGCFGPKWSL